MSEYIVIDQAAAIPFSVDVPFDVAAILGCAVITGVGAVINTARVRAGDSAAVIGCGGVGLSAIQGCKLAGCHPIIAVDVLDSKLEFARQMGATETVNSKQVDVVKTLRELTRVGPDYVFDMVGSGTTISKRCKPRHQMARQSSLVYTRQRSMCRYQRARLSSRTNACLVRSPAQCARRLICRDC